MAVFQNYILEIIIDKNGEYTHQLDWTWDENADKARLKGESKYYEKLSVAATDNSQSHAVTLLDAQGKSLKTEVYLHNQPQENQQNKSEE